jgi:hypothetical protein
VINNEKNEAISSLWKALIEVEDYFQNGIMSQLQETNSFSGENAVPIRNAYLVLKKCEPFLPDDIYSIAEASITIATDEFNKFLDELRMAINKSNREEAKHFAHRQLSSSLDKFRNSLLPLKNAIPQSVKDRQATNIVISGDVYGGQINVAGESIDSPSLNITLNDLIYKIDSSDVDEAEKKNIKEKVYEIIRHPLVASILGGAAGAILG